MTKEFCDICGRTIETHKKAAGFHSKELPFGG